MVARKSNVHSVLGSFVTGAALLGAAPLCGPAPALAQAFTIQTDSRSGSAAGQINKLDVASLVKTLNLDPGQEELVNALFEGHRAAWSDASRQHRENIRGLYQGQQQPNEWRVAASKMQEARKQWKAKSESLQRDFFESVKSIATPDQLNNWPRFERDRRRRTLLASQSALGGEGVDLIDVSESIDLPEPSLIQLQPVSNVYAEELDLALADRTRAIEALDKQMTPPNDGDFGAIDFEAVQESQKRLHEKRTTVRAVNERYAALFSSQLSADDAARFTQLYKERSFPRVYRPTAANRYIGAVRALETLNDEQIRSLDSIEADYERQVATINDQLVEIIRQSEEQEQGSGMFFGGGGMDLDMLPPPPLPPVGNSGEVVESESAIGIFVVATNQDGGDGASGGGGQVRQVQSSPPVLMLPGGETEDDSPRGKLNKSKRELVNRTIDAVAALLTPEQLAAAPKPDQLQRLTPEQRMHRVVEEALENAVFTIGGDGEQAITITVDPSSKDK